MLESPKDANFRWLNMHIYKNKNDIIEDQTSKIKGLNLPEIKNIYRDG